MPDDCRRAALATVLLIPLVPCASLSRSLLPYNRSLLTLTHTSGMAHYSGAMRISCTHGARLADDDGDGGGDGAERACV